MAEPLLGDDPEPLDRFPAGHLFTSAERLTAALGADQAWVRLAEPALRSMTTPLGITTVTVDPLFSAPAPAPIEPAHPVPALRNA
ncbi:SAV_915 family protein [Streptomyces massasporeus]